VNEAKRLRRSRGYSLMEMVVVGAVLGLVTAYMMQTVTYQQQAYVITEQVTQAQQNLRLISDLIERELRVAGYMAPPSAAACAADNTTAPDRLYLSATDRVRTVDALESIDLQLVRGNLGAPISIAAGALGTSDVDVDFDQVWVDVQADGTDFVEGGGVIIVDRSDANGVVACGTIDTWPASCPNGTGGCNNVRVDFEASNFSVPIGGDLVAVPAHVYDVDTATNRLFRDGVLMSSDVEDLQVVFYYDRDGDRVVDLAPAGSEELFGDAGTPSLPAPAAVDHNQLIEVRVNVVTVTSSDDPNGDFVGMKGQVTGNRNPASVVGSGTNDRKRRRVHSSSVRLRNLG